MDRPDMSTARAEVDSELANSDQHKNTVDVETADVGLTVLQIGRDSDDIFPGDVGSREAWMVLFGSFITLFPSFGMVTSIGTLQEYWHLHQLQDYSPRDIGWITGLFVYLSLGFSILIGPLFDRYGTKWIALTGSTLFVAMMFLLAECKEYWQFILCLGVLGGLSAAALTTTGMAVVSHWFKNRRGLASGIAMNGSSVGGTAIPLILRATLDKYSYAWGCRILGFMFLGCLIIGNLLMKPRLSLSAEAKSSGLFSLELFGRPEFSLLTLCIFSIEIVLVGTLGILPTYASMGTDFPADAGFNIVAILNAASCLGRFLPGLISDTYGRFNVLGVMMLTTLAMMLAIWLPFGHKNLIALYIFSALFGFGTGSWMALVPACIGQLCEAEQFGRYFGTLYFVASLATLICVPIVGQMVHSPQIMVAFLCAVLGVALIAFTLGRWACLGWKWSWRAKI